MQTYFANILCFYFSPSVFSRFCFSIFHLLIQVETSIKMYTPFIYDMVHMHISGTSQWSLAKNVV